MTETPAPARPAAATTTWLIAGIVCALAPVWLFAIAAFVGLGPASATLVFALPVVVSSVVAILAFLRLRKVGARGAALTVGILTIVFGVVGYFLWINLAWTGMQFGDGPL
ncbi:hypothetical protein [Agromyces sp. SYSU T00194]|uniref:hypothetical protein n=1 Tax=Agromyces chitinivorans TaxID=3158560 RepID=UPI0033972AEE